MLCCWLFIMQLALWPPCSKYLNPSRSSMKDFSLFPILFSISTRCTALSLSLSLLTYVSFSSIFISVAHSPSFTHSPSFILPLLHIDYCVAAQGSGELPTPARLRWISCHGDQNPQITNNGMLIMVITVWRLFQENERWYFFFFFSLEGLKKEKKCQRWSSLDNIIHNRALIAGVSGPSDGSGAKMEDPQRSSLPSAPRGEVWRRLCGEPGHTFLCNCPKNLCDVI